MKFIEFQINQYLHQHISVDVICFLVLSLLFLCYMLNDEANTKERTKKLGVLVVINLIFLLVHLIVVSIDLRTMHFSGSMFLLLLLVFATPLAIAIYSLFDAFNREKRTS